jgi:myo-inositol-1(or 4)-monophosphatase
MEPVEVRTAVRAARRAGRIIGEHLGRLAAGEVSRKEGAEFVTAVDRAAEQAIIDIISKEFPQDAIFAEESARQVGERRWLIDPLDGTTNFVHSYPMFSVSIALERKGEVVLGVVLDVLRDELFLARKGGGAELNGKRISTSELASPADALLATGFPFRARPRMGAYLKCFGRLLAQVHDMRRCGSAALDLAHVACGRLDGFWEISLKPWDMAAGSLLVREAGGVVSDFAGADGFLTSGDIVASNGHLHEFILEGVRGLRIKGKHSLTQP